MLFRAAIGGDGFERDKVFPFYFGCKGNTVRLPTIRMILCGCLLFQVVGMLPQIAGHFCYDSSGMPGFVFEYECPLCSMAGDKRFWPPIRRMDSGRPN